MKLKNVRLTLANVNRTTNAKDMEAIEVTVNRVRNEDGSMGRDVDSYSIECAAYHDTLKVKVGKELATKVTALQDALNDDVTVMVTFEGLKLKPYAMIGSDGKLLSGVSAKADDFNFVKADDLGIEL